MPRHPSPRSSLLIAALLVGGCATAAPPLPGFAEGFAPMEGYASPPAVAAQDEGVLDVGPAALVAYEPAPPVAVEELTVAASDAVVPESTYTVRPGDTLFAIARQQLGDASLWRDLLAANPQLPGDGAVRAGEQLALPR